MLQIVDPLSERKDTSRKKLQDLKGDPDAFRRLIDDHKQLIHNLLFRQLGETTLAEEFSQEVFIQAYRHINSFRGDSQLSTWLIRIALNISNSYFRSRRFKKLQRTQSLDEVPQQTAETNPASDLEYKEQRACLMRAYAALSPKLRDAFSLCQFEGKSYEETAAILEIPVGTVRSRVSHARQHMLTALKAHEEEIV